MFSLLYSMLVKLGPRTGSTRNILSASTSSACGKTLGVRWEMYLSDVEVLDRAKCPSIEALINKHRLRWCGHVVRMDDTRLPKQLFYGEIADGKRPARKPKLRYKDCLKTTLKKCNIDANTWESMAADRDRWRKEVHIGSNKFESDRKQYERLKRENRKGNIQEMSKEQIKQIGIACVDCGRICLSEAGLKSHQRSHRTQKSCRTQEPQKTNYISNTDKICQECGKICKSASR